jgi:hypothetical protein
MRRDDIVKYISQRIKWRGHHNSMEKTEAVRNITQWNPIGMRSKGRPKIDWEMRC